MLPKPLRRHTRKAIKQPQLASDRLCRIVFSVDGSDYEMEIFPHSQMAQLAQQLAAFMGLECVSLFEQEIRSKMQQLYQNAEQDALWKSQMLNILNRQVGSNNQSNDLDSNSFIEWRALVQNNQGKKRWYFETNEINHPTIDQEEQSRQNQPQQFLQKCPSHMDLYQRGLYNRQIREERINSHKMQQQHSEMSECTFHPKIHSKTPGRNEQIFDRLYQNAFELKKKKQERFNTLQSQIQEENSKLSFAPSLNQCSRQIVRMRNQSLEQSISPHKSHCQSYNLLPNKKNLLSQKLNDSKNKTKENHKKMFSFHPQLSQNTKKIAENLPKFQERLAKYNEKNKKKLSPHKIEQKSKLSSSYSSMSNLGSTKLKKTNKFDLNMNSSGLKIKEVEVRQTQRAKRSKEPSYFNDETSKKAINMSQILKPKRELYHLDDNLVAEQMSPKQQPVKKDKKPVFQDVTNVSHSNYLSTLEKQCIQKPSRSEQLYNTRKNAIFQRIYQYLTERKPKTVCEFSHKGSKRMEKQQIGTWMIRQHPHLPMMIKGMFEPMATEMGQLNITLDRQEFIWSLQRIYEELTLSDKGVLLGWGVKLLPEGSSFI